MPIEGYASWSVRRRYEDWIRALVELGAAGLTKYQGRTRFVASAAQELLHEVLLAKTLALSPDVAAEVLKRAGLTDPQNATLLEYQG